MKNFSKIIEENLEIEKKEDVKESLKESLDVKFMKLALEEAKKASDIGEIPIGAVLVLDGKVIAKAHNMREIWQDSTAHAEVIVIKEACRILKKWRLSGATLYVTIEPCPMCAGAIVMSRISRLVYGSPDSKAGAAGSLFNIVEHSKLNHKVETICGVCQEECALIMKEFFKRRRAENKKLKEKNTEKKQKTPEI